jgi:sugar phosphate isomerase/epimerase
LISVKLACTSWAFERTFQSGDLTQLEFLDSAARELGCDGVVLDDRHFPRYDDDYLAQVRKMATDLGLTIAALASDTFFTADREVMRAAVERAETLGAPLLAGRLGTETALAWSEQLGKLGAAAGLAKAANVTLALRNAPGTFAATTHDCKRVTKEADSAWLRYGLEPGAFDAASDPLALQAKTVLLWSDAQQLPDVARWEGYCGFVALDRDAGDASIPEMRDAMRRWRIARAEFELNRT